MLVYTLLLALGLKTSWANPVARSPWQPTLYACANQLIIESQIHPLNSSTTFSQYWQCLYLRDNGGGSFSENSCWYDVRPLNLFHEDFLSYPSTRSIRTIRSIITQIPHCQWIAIQVARLPFPSPRITS